MSLPDLRNGIHRKRVLVIGMLDSIHLARWLGQFVDDEIDFAILASKKYRKLHPLTISLLNSISLEFWFSGTKLRNLFGALEI